MGTAHDDFHQGRIDVAYYLYYYCEQLNLTRSIQRYLVTWVPVWHLIQCFEKGNCHYHLVLHVEKGLRMMGRVGGKARRWDYDDDERRIHNRLKIMEKTARI